MALTIKLKLEEINYVEDRVEILANVSEYDDSDNVTQQFSRSRFIFPATMTLEEITDAIKFGEHYARYFE
jgi:hypothetical protein